MTNRKARNRKGFNCPSSSSNAIGQPCKGFSLVEAAVVLGVVGFVLGGIWVAAAHFSEEYKVNKTVEGIMQIIERTRNINKGFTPHQLRIAGGGGTQVSIFNGMYNAGAIPTDVFPKCNSGVTECYGLWGGNGLSGVRLHVVQLVGHPTGQYLLQIWVPKSSCAKLGMALAEINFNIYYIRMITLSFNTFYSNEEMTLNSLNTYCNFSPFYGIYFFP